MLLRIKFELIRKGPSQQELARAVGVHSSRLSKILHGRVRPRPRERVRIAREPRVPTWRLFPKLGRSRLAAKNRAGLRRQESRKGRSS